MKTLYLTIIIVTILISGLLISSYLPTASSTCIFGADGKPTSCNTGPYIMTSYSPPLQQVRHGITINQVKCNEGFVNIFKIAGGSPACVKLATAVNLVDRGSWLMNIHTAWFSYEPSETIPWLGNIPSDISTNHTEQCTMANSTWEYFKNQDIIPFEILWTYPNLVATPEGVAGQQPTTGFLVHVLPNESSIMNKLGFKERSDVYYPLDLSLTPRLSICDDSSGKTQSVMSHFEKAPVMINGVISDYSFNYTITGGQIEQANADIVNKELILSIKSTENGMLVADLPRTLIDSKIGGQDSAFIVLEDKTEVLFNQTTTSQSRILSIPFQHGISQIEIVAPVHIQ